ncbi:hypothetical protein ACFQZZ_28430 [Nocardia sp. GCM10030253]|uniref:hypothetical protein n=1 Tax=Nocardia sp. GCM10030253 TaxID=3273404 RepID=UPI00362F497D
MFSRLVSNVAQSIKARLVNSLGTASDNSAEDIWTFTDVVRAVDRNIVSNDGDFAADLNLSDRLSGHEPNTLPQLSPAHVTRGRNLLDDLDMGFIRSRLPSSVDGPGDPALGEIYLLQGFDGLPTLTGSRGVDEVIAAGGRELFRGVTDPRHAQEFRTGRRHFPGLAAEGRATGNGTYATTMRESALHYAGGNPEGVIRMALRPDARIIDFDQLFLENQHAIGFISDELPRLRQMDQTPEIAARIQELRDAWHVYIDKGRFAAAQGYDAYPTHGSMLNMDDRYWVILNRTALVVER